MRTVLVKESENQEEYGGESEAVAEGKADSFGHRYLLERGTTWGPDKTLKTLILPWVGLALVPPNEAASGVGWHFVLPSLREELLSVHQGVKQTLIGRIQQMIRW